MDLSSSEYFIQYHLFTRLQEPTFGMDLTLLKAEFPALKTRAFLAETTPEFDFRAGSKSV